MKYIKIRHPKSILLVDDAHLEIILGEKVKLPQKINSILFSI